MERCDCIVVRTRCGYRNPDLFPGQFEGGSVLMTLGYRLEGCKSKSQHHQDATVGLLSKALNPQLAQFVSH